MALPNHRPFLLTAGCAGAWYSHTKSFQPLPKPRERDRVSVSYAGTVLHGEVNLTAFVELVNGQLVTRPLTQTPSIYVPYTREQKRSTSSSGREWETVETLENSVKVNLPDHTGKVRTLTKGSGRRID